MCMCGGYYLYSKITFDTSKHVIKNKTIKILRLMQGLDYTVINA